MSNVRELEKFKNEEEIVQIIGVQGKFKGCYGTAALTDRGNPYIFIGAGDGSDDHETSVDDFNNNYRIIGIE